MVFDERDLSLAEINYKLRFFNCDRYEGIHTDEDNKAYYRFVHDVDTEDEHYKIVYKQYLQSDDGQPEYITVDMVYEP